MREAWGVSFQSIIINHQRSMKHNPVGCHRVGSTHGNLRISRRLIHKRLQVGQEGKGAQGGAGGEGGEAICASGSSSSGKGSLMKKNSVLPNSVTGMSTHRAASVSGSRS
jgi:hypothetical protein